jgi:hypothetical protein
MTDLTQIPIAELIKSGLLKAALEQRDKQMQDGYESKVKE